MHFNSYLNVFIIIYSILLYGLVSLFNCVVRSQRSYLLVDATGFKKAAYRLTSEADRFLNSVTDSQPSDYAI